ncbi:Drug/metabolite transporter, partial [Aphelenchoides avenae]
MAIGHFTGLEPQLPLPTWYELSLVLFMCFVGSILMDYLWLYATVLTGSFISSLSVTLSIPLSMAADTFLRGEPPHVATIIASVPIMLSFVGATLLTTREMVHVDVEEKKPEVPSTKTSISTVSSDLSVNATFALLCGHTFHEPCISKWLGEYARDKCPLCGLRCDEDHVLRVRFDFMDADEAEPCDPLGAPNQRAVDHLAALKRRRHEPVIDAEDQPELEVHRVPPVQPLDFPVSRFLSRFALHPRPEYDKPMVALFVGSSIISYLTALVLLDLGNESKFSDI